MKLVINNINASSKRDALRDICNKLKSEGQICKINREHHCVDIFDNNGMISGQAYPTKTGTVPSTRNRYQYVGNNMGDYIKLTYNVNQSDYSSDNPYIKFIRTTNDPNDNRA